jgi:general secretion pathway protein F
MPLFTYQAVDVHGVRQSGEIACANRVTALEILRARGMTPVALSPMSELTRPSALLRLRKIQLTGSKELGSTQIMWVTQSLAALLKAGLTINRALAICANLQDDIQSRRVLVELGKSVRAGRSFADALSERGLALPAYYVGLIRAGEAGGSLGQTLSRLAELLRRQYEVRERIRSALIYPALLGFVVLVTIVLLLTFVLPRFEALFAESEAPLPWSTRAVLAVGGFVSAYWWLLGLLIAGAVSSLIAFIRTPSGRLRLDRWLLRSRLMFGLPMAIESARLLRTLGTLLANGVQVGSAMRIGRATLTNSVMQKGLDEAAQRVKAGASTSAALQAAGVFPVHAVQLARVGEETGRLEELLLEAASMLEHESSTRLERLLALAVPTLTMLMGVLIAALIGSVLIGLLSVNDLAF